MFYFLWRGMNWLTGGKDSGGIDIAGSISVWPRSHKTLLIVSRLQAPDLRCSDWNIRNNPWLRPGEQCEPGQAVFRPTQSRSEYCVSDPNQPLSIQLFVIIIEKGVKGFTQLTVIPLAYASHGIGHGSRYFHSMVPGPADRMTELDQFAYASLCNKVLAVDPFTYSCSQSLLVLWRTLNSIYICV